MQNYGKKNHTNIKGQAKRWLSFLLAVVLVVSMCNVPVVEGYAAPATGAQTVSVNDADEGQEIEVVPETYAAADDGLQPEEEIAVEREGNAFSADGSVDIKVTGDELKILKVGSSGTGRMADIETPVSGSWYGNNWRNITKIIIGDGVTYIGQNAFAGMPNLETVSFDTSGVAVTIGEEAFSGCDRLTEVDFNNTNLAEIKIGAFAGCKKLAELVISKDSTVFPTGDGESIFGGGAGSETELQKVMIRCNRGSNAYTYCTKDESAAAMVHEAGPFSVKKNSSGTASADIYELGGEYVLYLSGSGKMKDFSGADDVPWKAQRNMITTVVVEDGITSIGAYAFWGCTNLKKVTISDQISALEIGSHAFEGCSALENIEFPKDTVVTVGESAFQDCNNLKKIKTLNNSTKFDGDKIFWNSAKNANNTVTIRCRQGGFAYYFCQDNLYAELELVDENDVEINVPRHTVSFFDHNARLIEKRQVQEGTYIKPSDAPVAEREDYIFTGWNPEIPVGGYKVTEDIGFTAQYKKATMAENDISADGDENEVFYELTNDGTLVIEGSGAIRDFDGPDDCPWYEEREFIRAVVFKGAITHIGTNVCNGLTACTAVSFEDITWRSFDIADHAFRDTGITRLVLPANTGNVACSAFWNTDNLEAVDVHGGTLHGNPFEKRGISTRGITVTFFDMGRTTLVKAASRPLGKEGEGVLGKDATGTNLHLVFADGSAAIANKGLIDWTRVENIYVPSGTDLSGIPLSAEFGCTVMFTADREAKTAQIESVMPRHGDIKTLDLPAVILDCEIMSVRTRPDGFVITHTKSAHKTNGNNTACLICGKHQYDTVNGTGADAGRYIITKFYNESTYYSLIVDEDILLDEPIPTYYKLRDSFALAGGKTLEVPKDCTLIVPKNVTLTVNYGAELLLNGKVLVEDGGQFVNKGDIRGSGKFEGGERAKFTTVPKPDNIYLEGEEDFNAEMGVITIAPEVRHEWWGVRFYIDYDEDADIVYEKFTGTYEKEEINPNKWIEVTEVSGKGVYHFVYIDPKTGEISKKRFVVKKPKGTATITQENWYYGESRIFPEVTSETNIGINNYTLYYKEAGEEDDAYQRAYPELPGDYVVRVRYKETETHLPAYAETTFSILPRPITITMDDRTIRYKDSEPADYSFMVTGGMGLADGDTISTEDPKVAIFLEPVCSAKFEDLNGQKRDPNAGKYEIDADCTVAYDKYDVTVEKGTLTIEKIVPTLTIAPENLAYEKTFGDYEFTLQGITREGNGLLKYELFAPDAEPEDEPLAECDVISVSTQGVVTILNAGEDPNALTDVKIRVTVMEGTNYKESRPQEIKVKVNPKEIDGDVTAADLYYLCSDPNKLDISVADLMAECPDLSGHPGDITISFNRDADIMPKWSADSLIGSNPIVKGADTIYTETIATTTESDWAFTVRVTKARNYVPKSPADYIVVKFHIYLRERLNLEPEGGAGSIQFTSDKTELTYGEPLSALKFKDVRFIGREDKRIVPGTLTFRDDANTVLDKGTHEVEWIFTPSNQKDQKRYNVCTGTVSVTVRAAQPNISDSQLPKVSGNVVTYDPYQTLGDLALVRGGTPHGGKWEWVDPDEVPECAKTEYKVVYRPEDENYAEVVKVISFPVKPATPEFETKPAAMGSQVYGNTIDQWGITAGRVVFHSAFSSNITEVRGSYAWEDETVVPTVVNNGKEVYTVVFTPGGNYAPIKTEISVNVIPAEYAPGFTEEEYGEVHTVLTENKNKTVGRVPAPAENWIWDSADLEKKVPTLAAIADGTAGGPVSVNAVYDGSDKGNYEHETVAYEITREDCVAASEYAYARPEDMPTCTVSGNGQIVCRLCGDVLEENVPVQPLGHNYADPEFTWSVSENDVGATSAVARFVCCRDGCGEHEEGHERVLDCEVTCKVTPPTCTEDGVDHYAAQVKLKVNNKETNYKDVEKTYKDKNEPKVMHAKLGHLFAPRFFANEDGSILEEGSSVSANNPDETCFIWTEENKKCSVDFVCGRCRKVERVTEPTTCTATNTCVDDGTATYIATIEYHDAYVDYVLHAKKVTVAKKIGHKYYNTEYTKIATCTEGGYYTKRCNFPGCRAYYYLNVPPLGHKGGTATCTHAALCERCGEAYGEPDGDVHEGEEIRDRKANSCMTDGYSGDKYCTSCKALLERGTVIPKMGTHNWDKGIVIKEASLLENGQRKYTCKRCGETRIQVFYYVPQKSEAPRQELKQDDAKQATYELTADPDNTKKLEVVYVRPVTPQKKVVIPDTVVIAGRKFDVTGIKKGAFKGDGKIESVAFGKNITEIPASCFENCKSLKSVSVGSNVNEIGKKAFYNCKKLRSVKIGSKVTEIRAKAFAKCPKLKKITIPASVKKLGASVFASDKALKTVVIKTKKLKSSTLNKKTFSGLSEKVTIKVPKSKVKTYKKLFRKKGLSKKVKVTKI